MTQAARFTAATRRPSAFSCSVSVLAITAMLVGTPLSAMAAGVSQTALPQGGKVAAGSATIDYSATAPRLDINQTSERAVIDWNSFNIGEKATTDFHQLDSNSVAVNRVHDVAPSQILGNLEANGKVIVLNDNGVLFGKDAKVDVGGLVASTGRIDQQKFMDTGAVELSHLNTGGKIVNDGSITVHDSGLSAFVAPDVENNGVINAKLGKVALAAGGDRATVDLYGDGLVELALDQSTSAAVAKNTGTIRADGGTIAITASAAEGVVNSIVNVGGVVEANTVDTSEGKIVLKGSNADVVVTGDVAAKGGKNAAEDGGQIAVTSDTNVYTAAGSTLDASAGKTGKGGDVTIIADKQAYIYGAAKARGGSAHGDGGHIETSGKEYLEYAGTVDAGATDGLAGSWLLDPRNLVIDDGNQHIAGTGAFGDQYRPTAGPSATSASHIDVAEIEAALNADTSVYLTTFGSPAAGTQKGDIGIDRTISVVGGNNASLNLSAEGYIEFGGTSTGIHSTNGLDVSLKSDSFINVNQAIDVQGNVLVNAAGNVNITKSISSGGGDVTVDGQKVRLGAGAALDASGGNILLNNASTFTSADADSLRTSGTGTIALNQYDTGSLQNAVDALDNTGSGTNTLNAKAGTYKEQLTLTQDNLNLQGDGAGATIIRAPNALANSFTDFNGTHRAVIAVDGQDEVNIDGVTVEAHGVGAGTAAEIDGIAYLNSTGAVTNSDVKGATAAAGKVGVGIYAAETDGAFHGFAANGDTVEDFQTAGIAVTGVTLDAIVSGDTINGNAVPGVVGIAANGVDTVAIADNTVKNVSGDGIYVVGSNNAIITANTVKNVGGNGIYVDTTAVSIIGSQNKLSGIGGDGIKLFRDFEAAVGFNTMNDVTGDAIHVTESTDVILTNNKATTVGGAGVWVTDSDNVSVDNSKFTDVTGAGLFFNNTATVEATNNTLTTVGGDGIDVLGATGTVTLHKNDLSGIGATGIVLANDATATVTGNTVDGAQTGIYAFHADDLDLANNTISNTTSDGVFATGSTTLDVHGNTLSRIGGTGLNLDTNDGVTVKNNTIGQATGDGIKLHLDGDAAVTGNTLNVIGADGIHMTDSGTTTITGNHLTTVTGAGLWATDSDGVVVDNNSFVSITGAGIFMNGVADMTVHNNTLHFIHGDMIDALNGDTATITGNDLFDGKSTAIVVGTVNTATVSHNSVVDMAGAGLYLVGALDATVNGNTVTATNGGPGITVIGSDTATIHNNTIAHTTGDGIYVNADDATVTGNDLSRIHGDGIDVETGTMARVANNTLSEVFQNGIKMHGVAQGEILRNTVGHVLLDGIHVTDDGRTRVNRNDLTAIDGAGIWATDSNRLTANRNTMSDMRSKGIFANNVKNVTADNNTLSGVAGDGIDVLNATGVVTLADNGMTTVGGAGIVLGDDASATVAGNTITDATVGIFTDGVTNLVVDSNNIVDAATIGMELGGVGADSVVVRDNTVTSNGDGMVFTGGAVDLQGTNTITSANDGLVFDALATGTGLSLVGDTFGTTVLNGQGGFYIDLKNGALFQPGEPTILDARFVTFDGFQPNSFTLPLATYLSLEAKLHDFDDDNTLGQIFFQPDVASFIQPQERFARIAGQRPGSLTILGLPYAPGAVPASVLAGLSSNAGPDSQGGGVGLSADQLNALDSGAGPDLAGSWSDVYSHFDAKNGPVTYNLDTTPSVLLDTRVASGAI